MMFKNMLRVTQVEFSYTITLEQRNELWKRIALDIGFHLLMKNVLEEGISSKYAMRGSLEIGCLPCR